MIEQKTLDTIQKTDQKLDKSNLVDEKEIIRRIKLTEDFFNRIKNKSLSSIQQNANAKQILEFQQKSDKLHGEFQQKLKQLEQMLTVLNEGEEQEYQNIMQSFDEYVKSLQADGILGIDHDTEKSIENIEDLKDFAYQVVGIDKDTEKNGPVGKLIKGILDSVVMSNIDLLHQIYETKGKILADLVDFLLSKEGLSLLAEQLGKSVSDLVSLNAYDTGKAIGDLGMTISGGVLMFKSAGKLVKFGMKGVKAVATEGLTGLTLTSAEFTAIIERAPAYLKKPFEIVFGELKPGKAMSLFLKEFKGREAEVIKKYVKAFEINNRLLGQEEHAYISSMATYILLKDYKKLPGDLDIAMNLKDLNSIRTFVEKAKAIPDIKDMKFYEVTGKASVRQINGSDMNDILKVADEGKLSIKYNIDVGDDIPAFKGGLEVELFPEKDGKGLTNLGYMKKDIKYHPVPIEGKGEISIPTLDNLGTSEGYVMNFLNEFGSNTLEGLQAGAKVKDSYRINNIYLLLKEAGIINNPDDLIQFAQRTAEEYKNGLPSPAPYVKEAIDPKNLKEGTELLERIVRGFKIDLAKNKEFIKKIKLGELPDFDSFKAQIDQIKDGTLSLYKRYLNGESGLKPEILNQTEKLKKYLDGEKLKIINEDQFIYYYEYHMTMELVKKIKSTL